ncbi:MAG: hypothetical protein M1826_002585 [Phylliscum demangeonii]|nr:MAG: hypothetical protein M1826_002585 [Phylliscum demangeonii]
MRSWYNRIKAPEIYREGSCVARPSTRGGYQLKSPPKKQRLKAILWGRGSRTWTCVDGVAHTVTNVDVYNIASLPKTLSAAVMRGEAVADPGFIAKDILFGWGTMKYVYGSHQCQRVHFTSIVHGMPDAPFFTGCLRLPDKAEDPHTLAPAPAPGNADWLMIVKWSNTGMMYQLNTVGGGMPPAFSPTGCRYSGPPIVQSMSAQYWFYADIDRAGITNDNRPDDICLIAPERKAFGWGRVFENY